MQVLCVVMEHLDLSVREFLNSLGSSNVGESSENNTTNPNIAHMSMEYSISDDEESGAALSQQLDRLDKGPVSLKSKM